MSFSVKVKGSARKELRALPQSVQARIGAAIDGLTENPYSGGPLKGGLQGLRRIRIGDCRVLYEVQDEMLVVLVIRVATRGRAYR